MSQESLPFDLDLADEKMLTAIGYTKDRLITTLTKNAIEATPNQLSVLARRLISTVQQAAAEELSEALLHLRDPDTLTERQAWALCRQIHLEIAERPALRTYFTRHCGIEVELTGTVQCQIHMYFNAYGRGYAEMWIWDEADWKKEVAQILHEVLETSW